MAEMIYEIALATGNAGKAQEIADILSRSGGIAGGLRVRTLKEIIGSMPYIEENGLTLRENARIKALAARKAMDEFFGAKRKTGPATVEKAKTEEIAASGAHVIAAADDSGLFVDSLGGRPGVFSARYGGSPGAVPEPSRQMEMLLDEMKNIPPEARAARFRCVMAIVYPGGRLSFAEGECEGFIAMRPKGSGGFGYDPIFYLSAFDRTMAELSSDEKNEISHRGAAVRQMADDIQSYMALQT